MAIKHRTLLSYQGSLTRRLLCLFLFTAITPLIIVGILEYFNAERALTEGRQRHLSAVNLLIANELEHYYNDTLNNLFSHATQAASLVKSIKSSWLHSGQSLKRYLSSEEYQRLLANKAEAFNQLLRFHGYTQLLIQDKKGHILFSKGTLNLLADSLNTHPKLSQSSLALATKSALTQEEWQYVPSFAYPTDNPGQPIKTSFFVIPLLGENEESIGTLSIGLPASQDTQKTLKQSQEIGSHSTSYLIDAQKKVRFISTYDTIAPLSNQHSNAEILHHTVQAWLKNDAKQVFRVTQYPNANNEMMLGVAHPLNIAGIPMLLVTEVPVQEAFSTITNFRSYVLWLILAVISVVTILSIFLVIHITRPVKKITQWANCIAEGNYIKMSPLSYNDEIGKLSHSFSIMADKLYTMNKDNIARAWLQDGLIELNNLLRSEQHLPSLAQLVIDWLCFYNHVDAGEIWFYPNQASLKNQHPLAATKNNNERVSIHFKHTYKLPLLSHGKTAGQLVLKSMKPLTSLQRTFLELAIEPMTARFCNIQLHHQLEKSSQYKSEFLANISHELRTPLHSIITLSQVLEENKHGNLTKNQTLSAKTIYRVSQELLHIINDILDLSKVEAGKLEIQKASFNILPLLNTLEVQFAALAKKKGLAFSVNNEMPCAAIFTDKHRLLQILQNLLGNAIKFTEKGRIELKVTSPTSSTCLFTISDTGIGIPQDNQTIIFQAFQQADGSDSRRHNGSGLGLSVSRQLAHLLGGRITLQSQVGEGSNFMLSIPTLDLPREISSDEITTNFTPSPQSPIKNFQIPDIVTGTTISNQLVSRIKGICVLIIDQDLRQAFNVSRLLEPLGICVKLANSRKLVQDKLASPPLVHIVIIEEQSLGVLDIIANSSQCKQSSIILLSRSNKEFTAKVLPAYAGTTLHIPCSLQVLVETILMHYQQKPNNSTYNG